MSTSDLHRLIALIKTLLQRHEKTWLFPGFPIFRQATEAVERSGSKVTYFLRVWNSNIIFSITQTRSQEGLLINLSSYLSTTTAAYQWKDSASSLPALPSGISSWSYRCSIYRALRSRFSCVVIWRRLIFVLLFLGAFPLALPPSCLINKRKSKGWCERIHGPRLWLGYREQAVGVWSENCGWKRHFLEELVSIYKLIKLEGK